MIAGNDVNGVWNGAFINNLVHNIHAF